MSAISVSQICKFSPLNSILLDNVLARISRCDLRRTDKTITFMYRYVVPVQCTGTGVQVLGLYCTGTGREYL